MLRGTPEWRLVGMRWALTLDADGSAAGSFPRAEILERGDGVFEVSLWPSAGRVVTASGRYGAIEDAQRAALSDLAWLMETAPSRARNRAG